MGWKNKGKWEKKNTAEANGTSEGMTNRRVFRVLGVVVLAIAIGVVAENPRQWCESDRDCVDDGAPECNGTDHVCVPCTGDAACDNRVHGARVQCVGGRCNHTTCADAAGRCPSPHAFVCDLATRVCGPCTDDSQCAPLRYCDRGAASATRGSCFACQDDLDCAGAAPHCHAGACVPCAGDADCAARGLNRTCDTNATSPTRGHCVECLASRACASDAAPRCAPAEGVCAPCVADADCAAGHGANTVCDTNASSLTHGHCVRALGAASSLVPPSVLVLIALFLFATTAAGPGTSSSGLFS